MADSVGLKVNRTFLNLPVHTGFALPDVYRLFLCQLTAEAVPGARQRKPFVRFEES